MKLIKKYFKALNQIYDYFDYSSGEKVLPIEDYTEFDWYLNKSKNIIYYKTSEDKNFFSEKGNVYFGVYDSEMIMFEITDEVLLIFDSKKEIYFDD